MTEPVDPTEFTSSGSTRYGRYIGNNVHTTDKVTITANSGRYFFTEVGCSVESLFNGPPIGLAVVSESLSFLFYRLRPAR